MVSKEFASQQSLLAIYLLNFMFRYKVKSIADVDSLFENRAPRGGTPLMSKCKPILTGEWHPKGSDNDGNDLILLVMTDGEPSDCSFTELKQAIANKAKNIYVTFLMCTSEDEVVSKYNRYLDRIPFVDIVDDYHSEKKEVEHRGRHLSYFMWLGKSVLGAKLPKYDKMDEGKCCACLLQ
uniref:VWFA domain-containing protein n=1 Tax=Aureoumbra lagunensis TaxID=44058 RepID=A0A7S3NMD2_9STRA